jgi:hypothetical protein
MLTKHFESRDSNDQFCYNDQGDEMRKVAKLDQALSQKGKLSHYSPSMITLLHSVSDSVGVDAGPVTPASTLLPFPAAMSTITGPTRVNFLWMGPSLMFFHLYAEEGVSVPHFEMITSSTVAMKQSNFPPPLLLSRE